MEKLWIFGGKCGLVPLKENSFKKSWGSHDRFLDPPLTFGFLVFGFQFFSFWGLDSGEMTFGILGENQLFTYNMDSIMEYKGCLEYPA